MIYECCETCACRKMKDNKAVPGMFKPCACPRPLNLEDDLRSTIAAQATEIERLKQELATANECLTIAYMDGHHRGRDGIRALIVNNTFLRDRVVELNGRVEALEWLVEVQHAWDDPVYHLRIRKSAWNEFHASWEAARAAAGAE